MYFRSVLSVALLFSSSIALPTENDEPAINDEKPRSPSMGRDNTYDDAYATSTPFYSSPTSSPSDTPFHSCSSSSSAPSTGPSPTPTSYHPPSPTPGNPGCPNDGECDHEPPAETIECNSRARIRPQRVGTKTLDFGSDSNTTMTGYWFDLGNGDFDEIERCILSHAFYVVPEKKASHHMEIFPVPDSTVVLEADTQSLTTIPVADLLALPDAVFDIQTVRCKDYRTFVEVSMNVDVSEYTLEPFCALEI